MNYQEYTDSNLLLLLKRDDQKAFDAIYYRYWLRLYRIACKITEQENVAQDIVQEIFISFWEKGRHKDIKSVEAYLYQSVKFRCFMHLRSGHITQRHLEHFASLLVTSQAEDEVYVVRELEEQLEKSVASLPQKCREVFELSRVEHLPNKVIAEKLHISQKTVENQLTKALKHLRLSLDKFAAILVALNAWMF